jgi:hypothetical protein
MTEMTAAINKQPYVPGRIGQLGIFEEKGITTTSIIIEEQSGSLSLVPSTPRGAPPAQNTQSKRKQRSLVVPHLPIEDTVLASEVQDIRAFGTTQLQAVEQVRDQKLATMANRLDATLEYHRVGAIKGTVLDADGSTLFNLFTEFGVVQDTVDFLLGTAATPLLTKCTDVAGLIEDELGAMPYGYVRVICGKTWWAKFIEHAAVKDAYKYFQATGQNVHPMREDLRYTGFTFGGLVFEQYRGKVGATSFVADSEAHAFPVGVPGLFITRYAPGDFVETANTIGLPRYARSEPMRHNRGLEFVAETNPLNICTRPKALVKLTTSN